MEKRKKDRQHFIKDLVTSSFLIAIGVILPQVFHIFGQNAGMIFLPIQIPVLLAGLLLGSYYGGLVGILVVIVSSLLTAMPPVPKAFFMVFELASYGIVSGLAKGRWNPWFRLAAAMVAGRMVYGIALIIGVRIFGVQAPFANRTAFISGLVMGIPGMAIQFLVVPILYRVLNRERNLDETVI